MPLDLTSTAVADKNAVGSPDPYLICLEITVPGLSEKIRLVNDLDDLAWAGSTWQKFPFGASSIGESSAAEVNRVELWVDNVSGALAAYIHDWDAWCKQHAYQPITVEIYGVPTADLASGEPAVELEYELYQPRVTPERATFVLGEDSLFDYQCPRNRIAKSFCRFKFKDTRCGCASTASTCDHTLVRCRQLANSTRFGGFPGAGWSGVLLDV